jgi:hypothetical protein
VSIGDDERPGRPKEATNDETDKAVHGLVIRDRSRDLCSIAKEVGISFGSVQAILTDVYGMSKFPLDGPQTVDRQSQTDSA